MPRAPISKRWNTRRSLLRVHIPSNWVSAHLDHDLRWQCGTAVDLPESSEFLIPFVPSDGGLGLPEKSEYLEISTHGRGILDGLEYIKKHTTPPEELLRKTPSPRPVNATLSIDWHDNEVAQLDARRQQEGVTPLAAAPAAMDYGAGPSLFATNQDEHGLSYGFGNESFAWGTNGKPQDTSLDHFEAEVDQDAGPSASRQGGDDRKEVEVRVTRIPHNFRKDELCFDRNGRNQSSTEDDWVKRKRDNRTVWVYRHRKKTVYWTKKLG